MAMDRKLRTKWVKALRGGRYKQGTGQLRDRVGKGNRNSYCCLGVLCRAADLRFSAGNNVILENGDVDWTSNATLSPVLLRKFGLSQKQQSTLVDLNDGVGDAAPQEFKQIAAWIEKNIKVKKAKKRK